MRDEEDEEESLIEKATNGAMENPSPSAASPVSPFLPCSIPPSEDAPRIELKPPRRRGDDPPAPDRAEVIRRAVEMFGAEVRVKGAA